MSRSKRNLALNIVAGRNGNGLTIENKASMARVSRAMRTAISNNPQFIKERNKELKRLINKFQKRTDQWTRNLLNKIALPQLENGKQRYVHPWYQGLPSGGMYATIKRKEKNPTFTFRETLKRWRKMLDRMEKATKKDIEEAKFYKEGLKPGGWAKVWHIIKQHGTEEDLKGYTKRLTEKQQEFIRRYSRAETSLMGHSTGRQPHFGTPNKVNKFRIEPREKLLKNIAAERKYAKKWEYNIESNRKRITTTLTALGRKSNKMSPSRRITATARSK